MFIGHFGAGFGAKKIDPKPLLGTLFLAAQFIDLLWPLFILLGIEKVEIDPGITSANPLNFVYYPFSHSLLIVVIYGFCFALVYYLIKKNFKSSVVLGLLVIGHWFLDLIVHIPDLPLFPWESIKVGFGVWNSVLLTIVIEGTVFITGVYFYTSATKAKNKTGSIGLWSLVIFLIIIYIINFFGDPPPDAEAIGYVGLSQWLIIIWGYWIDRNRISA